MTCPPRHGAPFLLPLILVVLNGALAARARADSRAGSGASPSDDAALARQADLETIVRVARAANPALGETQERAAAAQARVDIARGLPDLELKYEQWGVPLNRPLALDRANMLMIGLRQAFPAPGTRSARARMASAEAAGVSEGRRLREQEVVVDVRRAYAEYARADHEYRLHLEHVGLLSRLVELIRAQYRSGRGSQQHLLQATLELSRLHTDLTELEQQQRSGRALLNTLMGRPVDAPLGPAAALHPQAPAVDSDQLAEDLEIHRPELTAAGHNVSRSQAALEMAQNAARWPALMVGADYWRMPTMPPSERNAYGAMVSINLPWLNPRHGDEVREARHALVADRKALDAQRNSARFQLRDAAARAHAAETAFLIVDGELLPQARRALESTQAAYESGQDNALAVLEALQSYLQVRIERLRAAARLLSSAAELERAAGTKIPLRPVTTETRP